MSTIKSVSFNTSSYDPFIDFLKAYSIFFVVFAHCFPVELYNFTLFQVWGDMQVPMFILIQTFHAYKKGEKPIINYPRLFRRIIFPFIFVQSILFITLSFDRINVNGLLNFVVSGGSGPGSYYFWIYLQIAVILPLMWPFIINASKRVLFFAFLTVSIAFEVYFSIIDFSDSIYRLLAVRYLFLIYLAYNLWVKGDVIISRKTILWSSVSIAFVLFFVFTDYDLEPFFFNTGWKFHRWICYYYVASLLTYVLWKVYQIIQKVNWFDNFTRILGQCSYEIYLMQMVVFTFFGSDNISLIYNIYIRTPLYMVFTTSLSIWLGVLLKKQVIDRIEYLRV